MLSLTGGRRTYIQLPCGQAPPLCLGQWGQTADQQTINKPENQQSSEPTDQQANNATNEKHTKQQERLTFGVIFGSIWDPLGALWESFFQHLFIFLKSHFLDALFA